jgi:hypothetical protein
MGLREGPREWMLRSLSQCRKGKQDRGPRRVQLGYDVHGVVESHVVNVKEKTGFF